MGVQELEALLDAHAFEEEKNSAVLEGIHGVEGYNGQQVNHHISRGIVLEGSW